MRNTLNEPGGWEFSKEFKNPHKNLHTDVNKLLKTSNFSSVINLESESKHIKCRMGALWNSLSSTKKKINSEADRKLGLKKKTGKHQKNPQNVKNVVSPFTNGSTCFPVHLRCIQDGQKVRIQFWNLKLTPNKRWSPKVVCLGHTGLLEQCLWGNSTPKVSMFPVCTHVFVHTLGSLPFLFSVYWKNTTFCLLFWTRKGDLDQIWQRRRF